MKWVCLEPEPLPDWLCAFILNPKENGMSISEVLDKILEE